MLYAARGGMGRAPTFPGRPFFSLDFLEPFHPEKTEHIGHHLLKCHDQREPKGAKSLVLEVNERGLDVRIRVWMFIEVRERGR